MITHPFPELVANHRLLQHIAQARRVDLSQDASLGKLLLQNPAYVIARLCHETFFKRGAKITDPIRVSTLTALALLSRSTGNEFIRIQGTRRLLSRLKMNLDILRTPDEKMTDEFEVRVVIGHQEYFVIAQDLMGDSLYGVLRISVSLPG